MPQRLIDALLEEDDTLKDKFIFDLPFSDVTNYENPNNDYSKTPRNLQCAAIQVAYSTGRLFNWKRLL